MTCGLTYWISHGNDDEVRRSRCVQAEVIRVVFAVGNLKAKMTQPVGLKVGAENGGRDGGYGNGRQAAELSIGPALPKPPESRSSSKMAHFAREIFSFFLQENDVQLRRMANAFIAGLTEGFVDVPRLLCLVHFSRSDPRVHKNMQPFTSGGATARETIYGNG